jgi:very-short-patch-repair endonuclease
MASYDAKRDAYLAAQDYQVLHFSDQQVKESLDGVCYEIEKRCKVRTKAPL